VTSCWQADGEDGAVGQRLETLFDGPASWWTQGVDEKLAVVLNRALAYGAGRYGHVLFPENATEVSLELARRLLDGVGKGWASRVFYSDNGSTAVEVAIKMALRKYMHDHALMSLADADLDLLDFGIIGLEGSYHGDTLAAMDIQVPPASPPPRPGSRDQCAVPSGAPGAPPRQAAAAGQPALPCR
jgi:adenosylmethionine-8-amino-7-oxononanoate aminotransferase